MVIVTTLSLPSETFTSDSRSLPPDVELEFEPFVPVGDGSRALLHVTGGDRDEVRELLGRVEAVESHSVLESSSEHHLVRVVWCDSPTGVFDCVRCSDATLLSVVATGEEWRLQVQFEEQGDVSRFQTCCRESEVSMRLLRLDRNGVPDSSLPLQPKQRQTLELALELGYFDIPREKTLQDLAEELGISDQSVSERLRRGLSTILEETLSER